jgi:glutamyl/glutaminyl-tRNA synthetase
VQVLSKRKLIQLVEEKHVNGWNDPRMPTISGVRRRGYTPEAMRLFAERIGISKAENNIDMSVLEDCARCKFGSLIAYIRSNTSHKSMYIHMYTKKSIAQTPRIKACIYICIPRRVSLKHLA